MAFEHSQVIKRKARPETEKHLISEGISPFAAQLLAARGIEQKDDITPALRDLPMPEELPGVQQASKALAAAVHDGERICVVGDYDVDGMTATTIAVDCLRRLQASVVWLIPNRKDGYGLSPDLAEQAAARGARWILTVDNGVSAVSGVMRAQSLGLKVCISDHHCFDEAPAPADCIVHPLLNGEATALANLTGVGVVFYLMAALCKRMNADFNISCYLDLVALGTIADCALLDKTNRSLVGGGLRLLRQKKGRVGLTTIAMQAKREIGMLTTSDLSFALIPRLNAAGRLASADIAMRCLLADDEKEAQSAVTQLEEINVQRVIIQKQVWEEVKSALPHSLLAGVVMINAKWHFGVVGIIASMLSAETDRPALILTASQDGNWKGSGRAPAGWNLLSLLKQVATARPDLMPSFGGHAGAVGMTLKNDGEDAFRRLFAEACAASAPPQQPRWEVDETPLPVLLTVEAVRETEEIAWGRGFQAPLFAGRLAVTKEVEVRGGHRQLQILFDGISFRAIHFNARINGKQYIDAIFHPFVSRYSGEVELLIEATLPS